MALLCMLVRKRWLLSLAAAALSALTAAVALWWNAQLSAIIDTVSAGGALTHAAVAWALAAMCAMSVTAYVKGYVSAYACESMAHDLRMGYARYFITLPAADAEALGVGEHISALQNELADVSAYLNANLFQLLDDGIRFITTLVWLMWLSPTLTLASNAPVIVIMAYVFWSSRAISAAVARGQQAKGVMNGFADTLLTLFPVIRLYDAARVVITGYGSAVGEWERHTVRSERVRARLMSLSALLSTLPLMLLFWVGGGMAIGGALSVGTLYVFLNLSGNVSGVMMNMPGFVAAFRQFAANMARVAPHVVINGPQTSEEHVV